MKQVINNLFFILVCFSLNAQSSNEAAVPPKRAHPNWFMMKPAKQL